MAQDAENTNKSTDASTLLATVLSNPDALAKMGEIIARSTNGTQGNNSPQSEDNSQDISNNEEHEGDNSDISKDASPTFQNLINPEMMSKLPEILSVLSSQKSPLSSENNQQTALLLAIRPYLSEHRRELIDSFIRFDRLGSILKKLT